MEQDKCFQCKKPMRRATASDLNGLVWADELQEWLCPSCDKRRISRVISNA